MSERPAQPPLPEPHPALALLGLRVPYSAEEAEQAFREAAKTAHPDHGGDPRRFVELQAAYEQALALLEQRKARRAPSKLPPLPLPRRRSKPAGGRGVSYLYLGIRVAAVTAVLTALIAGAMGLLHRRQNTAQRVDARAAEAVERLGGRVEWDGNSVARASLRGLEVGPSELETLRRFGMLEHLDLSGSTIDDAALVHLLPLVSLQEIDLSGTKVTDLGASMLRTMGGLERLNLDDTTLTDAALAYLDELPKLSAASLRGTAVTLDGIARTRYPERYHRDAASAVAGRAATVADFLPERQWAVQELRSAVADHGLLTSEELREASRIDLAVTYEREALSSAALESAIVVDPLPEPAARTRRVATLADLMAAEGGPSGGAGLSRGATMALSGRRSSRSLGGAVAKGGDAESGEGKGASAQERADNLSPIFGRRQASRSGQSPVAWLMPSDEPDGRLRPGFLSPRSTASEDERTGRDDWSQREAWDQPDEWGERDDQLPLPFAPGREPRGRSELLPKLDLPVAKRRNFYFGEIVGSGELPAYRGLSPSLGPNPFAPAGAGGRASLNPFGSGGGANPTGHLDALRRSGSRKMTVPGR